MRWIRVWWWKFKYARALARRQGVDQAEAELILGAADGGRILEAVHAIIDGQRAEVVAMLADEKLARDHALIAHTSGNLQALIALQDELLSRQAAGAERLKKDREK